METIKLNNYTPKALFLTWGGLYVRQNEEAVECRRTGVGK